LRATPTPAKEFILKARSVSHPSLQWAVGFPIPIQIIGGYLSKVKRLAMNRSTAVGPSLSVPAMGDTPPSSQASPPKVKNRKKIILQIDSKWYAIIVQALITSCFFM
jgi:hypothetical protein